MHPLSSALAIAVLGVALQAPGPAASAPGDLVIGMEAPSGAFSLDEENLGMRVRVEEVNDGGGIHGRRLLIRDYPRAGGTETEAALASARRLVDHDGVFLLFNFGGPASVEVARLASERRVPYLFPHTALLTGPAARYVFTSFPLYDQETRIMFRYLASRGFRRIAIAHDANPYGRYFRDRLREMAGSLGYQVAGEVELRRNPVDLTREAEQLRVTRPDAVVLALFPDQVRPLMAAKAALRWTATMVTSGPLTDEQYLASGGAFADGTLGFCHFEDPQASEARGIAAYRAAMARYRPGHPLNRYSLYGYVFGGLVLEGLRRAGPDPTRERFIDAMESIAGWDAGGALPPVTFSPGDHHAQRAGFVCELRGGRFRALTGWLHP